MNEQILNLVKQMSESEKLRLFLSIKDDYTLEEKTGMLRDDIVHKVSELLCMDFIHIGMASIRDEVSLQEELELDAVEVVAFSDTLLTNFGLENIPFSEVMKWETVADIVNYIEENLEKLHISSFEEGEQDEQT